MKRRRWQTATCGRAIATNGPTATVVISQRAKSRHWIHALLKFNSSMNNADRPMQVRIPQPTMTKKAMKATNGTPGIKVPPYILLATTYTAQTMMP
mmetsp:Transcript_33918/g.94522  ORF Transcript_33918/g.94522 Transcript_33918/m.94522 type:complete len:96 (-) Transcript_33918:31-318(-)